MPQHPNQIVQRVNESGFPFQFRIREDVETDSSKYGWAVIGWEEPWNDEESNQSGFIDLILAHGNIRLILECKRVTQGEWIFLVPVRENFQQGRITPLTTTVRADGTPRSIQWLDTQIQPATIESAFCVMRREGQKDSIQLEKLVGEIVNSMEATATKWLKLGAPEPRAYFGAIVTNAELHVCTFNPTDVDIQTGTLEEKQTKSETVDYIRFRRSMLTRFDVTGNPQEAERSIFVIRASALTKFLRSFQGVL